MSYILLFPPKEKKMLVTNHLSFLFLGAQRVFSAYKHIHLFYPRPHEEAGKS